MAIDYENEVQKLYVAYFSRPADVGGLAYWSNLLATNPDAYQLISASFASSQEYHDEYANMSNREIVNAVYQNLFGRAAEADGLNYWANLLDSKKITIDNVVKDISAAALGSDEYAFKAKVAVAGAFTDRMDLPAEQQAYAGNTARDIAIDYIAAVKEITSAAAGMDGGNIDMAIAKFTPGQTSSAADMAQLVGVAPVDHVIHG